MSDRQSINVGTVIDLKYWGICLRGPWDGQQVNAELPRIDIPAGSYEHVDQAWLWTAKAPLP